MSLSTVLAFLVGLLLGGAHGLLFLRTVSGLVRAGRTARMLVLLTSVSRTAALGLAALFFWRVLTLPPLPLCIGLALSYAVLRGVLVLRVR